MAQQVKVLTSKSPFAVLTHTAEGEFQPPQVVLQSLYVRSGKHRHEHTRSLKF